MSSGAELTNAVRERMAADGVDLSQPVPVNDPRGSSAEGTGGEPTPVTNPTISSAGTSNTDGQTGQTPDTIPYSRFTEVNSRLQAMRPWEQIAAQYATMGIEPDSAVRLASFEQAYIQDPVGTLSAMIDQQDLPDAQKTALKALLSSQQDGALSTEPSDDSQAPKLPDEVMEAVGWVREQRQAANDADIQSRLDFLVRHWRPRDRVLSSRLSKSWRMRRERPFWRIVTPISGPLYRNDEQREGLLRYPLVDFRPRNPSSLRR